MPPFSGEDVIDDYLGGSFSEAADVLQEVLGNGTAGTGANTTGSDRADLQDDLVASQAAQDAGAEGVETTSSINTTASLGVAMSLVTVGCKHKGTINLGGGSVSGGSLSYNGILPLLESHSTLLLLPFLQYMVWIERLTQIQPTQTFQLQWL